MHNIEASMKNKKKFFFAILLTFLFIGEIFAKNSFFSEGKALYDKKNFSESKFKFEKDIVFNPKNENSYLYLAKIFKVEKNEFSEEKNLNTVILLNPKNEEAIYLLTLLKIKQSNYSESEKLIKNFKQVCNKLCDNQNELNKKFENIKTR
tara:strand:- start:1099 stop:1548 length:450 start_codon:yes stop_codon:yes gene_type:complete